MPIILKHYWNKKVHTKIKSKTLSILLLICLLIISFNSSANNTTINNINSKSASHISNQALFLCVADGTEPCGCLIQNDGSDNPLMWYRYSSIHNYSFTEANTSFISDFNSGNGHCGYRDWRLPTTGTDLVNNVSLSFENGRILGEFAFLANYAHMHGYEYRSNLSDWLRLNGFSNVGNNNEVGPYKYWSSSTYLYNLGIWAWYTNMTNGSISILPSISSTTAKVLPVRGGVPDHHFPWKSYGSPGFSSGAVQSPYIAFNPANNQPYIIYSDSANGGRASVMTYTNGTNSWEIVGSPGFSISEATNAAIAFDPGSNDLYAAYTIIKPDRPGVGEVKIMKFDGSSWTNVGGNDLAIGVTGYKSIAFNPRNRQPYVVYSDYNNANKLSVITFNGKSWVYVGMPGFSEGQANYISIAFSPFDAIPYVVYSDASNSNKVSVMKFDGNDWVYIGNPGGASSGRASFTDIAFDRVSQNSQPYIVYTETGNMFKATVRKFNGVTWDNVGSTGFSSATPAFYTRIVINQFNNQPYIVYTDISNKINVVTFNGNSWETIGNSNSAAGGASYTDIAIGTTDGKVYISYIDKELSNKATVIKYF